MHHVTTNHVSKALRESPFDTANNTIDSTGVTNDPDFNTEWRPHVVRQVNLKYDAWQKELQGSFATILAEETRQVSPVPLAAFGAS